MRGRLFYKITLSCISLVLIGCASATIDTYQAKTPDEEAIIKVLRVNDETRRNENLSGNLATYDDNASIMIFYSNEGRPMVSKKRYAEYVPTSDWWGSGAGEISGITIVVSGDTATIKCFHRTIDGHASPHSIVMVKENDAWLIKKWSFGRYN